jgi:hypothetical protein
MARTLVVLVVIFLAEMVFAVSTAQARLGWTLAQSVQMYGPYETTMQDVPGYLPGTVYGFLDKTVDQNHPQLDLILESYLDGKVGLITYANSDQTELKAGEIQKALFLNAPEADWSVKEEFFVGKVSGEVKYLAKLHGATMLIIGTGEYFDTMNAAKDAGTAAPTAPESVAAPTPAGSLPTNVVSVITGNRWTSDSLIVSGTLTNTSTVAVKITGIDANGFSQDKKVIVRGSDYTIVHNDLAPGEAVNFKIALKDNTKQVKFVKVAPSWSPSLQ